MANYLGYISYHKVCYDWLHAQTGTGRGKGTVDSLLAMSRRHDPFYCGSPADQAKARWFGTVWRLLGLDKSAGRVHLRRVHYQLVSRSREMPPITWGGVPGPYLNIEDHWQQLLDAAMKARYLGVVPFARIMDQRNPPAVQNAKATFDPTPQVTVKLEQFHSGAWLPRELVWDLPEYEVDGYDSPQRYHCEVWVEKSTMEDVLRPICQRWDANLMHASGELSATQVYEAALRIVASGKPARIFYISDYDPAGQRMPVSAGRKLEWLMHGLLSTLRSRFQLRSFDDKDVTVTPIALTEEQIEEYGLPRQPLKAQAGKDQWELLRGEGGVELDALEALHPGELGRIVSDELRAIYDEDLDRRVVDAARAAEDHVDGLREEVLARHQEALATLQEEYTAVCAEANPRLKALTDKLEVELAAIKSEMEEAVADVDLATEFPVPEADEAEFDDPDEALVWSGRSYDEQLEAFHRFQRRDELADAA